MVTRGRFSFKRGSNKIYSFTLDFRTQLTQIGAQLAKLELVDDQRAIIPYPAGFKIPSTLYNENVQMIRGVYVNILNASYIVSVNNVSHVRIFNQREMAVFKEHEGVADEIVADEPAIEVW